MHADIGYLSSPFAQCLIDPEQDKVLLASLEACRFFALDIPEVMQTRASHLFKGELAEFIVFTEETLEKGKAWAPNMMLNGVDVEISSKSVIQGDKKLMQICFQNSDEIAIRRDRAEAQYHYRSGLGQWRRINRIFQEFERHNHLLLDAAGEGIYGVDSEGRTTFVNAAAEKLLGWKAAQLSGKNIHRIIHHSHTDGSEYHVVECPIYQAFRDGIVRSVDDEVFWTRDGNPINVEYTSTPIKDCGHVIGAVVIFRDVTEKKRDHQRLLDALDEVEKLKQSLEMENAYLQEELDSEFNHHQIIGHSTAIQHVLERIELVAPSDVTVLISGESGTGKELIARAIHDASVRSQRSLIRVNCAAVPAELFESEFFGHAKGAFTGATSDRPGRFELANEGTLFLDEVGEIPLQLQSKLLRVLQEQQFERIGESQTRHIDVRIIAATNRDLKKQVAEGLFREDLYYRLNVFPIESIPLRLRQEDIPMLAQHFLHKAAKKANKSGLKITSPQLDKLQAYAWPGNIRELENVIERQVILARGSYLNFDDLIVHSSNASLPLDEPGRPGLLTEQEIKKKEVFNLVTALKQSQGKVSGKGGAADILGIKSTTLESRIKKYGIDKRRFKI